jgi:hypothetical protein
MKIRESCLALTMLRIKLFDGVSAGGRANLPEQFLSWSAEK